MGTSIALPLKFPLKARPMSIHFATFADGSDDLRAAAQRLRAQAHESDWFATCTAWHLQDLQAFAPAWVAQHLPFIRAHRRGFGYWIWKPFMIFEKLKTLPWNDYLVALDSGYEVSLLGKPRFEQYIEMAAAHDLLGFEIAEEIGRWTKGDVLDYFGVPRHHALVRDRQIQSGFLVIKKTFHSLMFLSQWAEVCVARNYSLVDDSPSQAPNQPNFAENRHDQAILTLLARMGNFGYFPESEDYHPELLRQGQFNAQIPFQCFRNKTGNRLIPAP